MQYMEVEPIGALRHILSCIWGLRGTAQAGAIEVERITPDGCTEIIINRADPFQRAAPCGEFRTQSAILAVGQITGPIEVRPTGAIDLLALRFQPGGMHELTGVPMHELTGRDVSLCQIDRSLFSQLESVAHAQPRARAIFALQHALLNQHHNQRKQTYRKRALANAQMLRHTLTLMKQGPARADSVALAMGLTRRSLERLFRTSVGLSPKLYLRIERLQAVLAKLESSHGPANWSDLAFAYGYSDQSHMIRDFRILAGTTPTKYLNERGAMAALLSSKPA